MNIQLRDSKPLQDAIRDAAKQRRLLPPTARIELPRAQLHPSLLHGIVECDRDRFTVRSEVLTGEQTGEPDQTDVKNLTAFLPQSGSCKSKWRIVELKQGDSVARIPSELIFEFADGAKLAIHTQAVADIAKLTNAIPSDQSATFNVTNDGGKLSFVRVGSAGAATMPGLSTADLQTLAPQLGVVWDASASIETMIERIQAAIAAKKGNEGAKAKGKKLELEAVGA